MDQLIRLGTPQQQTAEVLRTSSTTDEEPHQHPLVTHGHGGSQVAAKKKRITPAQIFSNYRHARPKGAA